MVFERFSKMSIELFKAFNEFQEVSGSHPLFFQGVLVRVPKLMKASSDFQWVLRGFKEVSWGFQDFSFISLGFCGFFEVHMNFR